MIEEQEAIEKFGKYTRIQQYLHWSHIQLMDNTEPCDAQRIRMHKDKHVSNFDKEFQRVSVDYDIFLVNTAMTSRSCVTSRAL